MGLDIIFGYWLLLPLGPLILRLVLAWEFIVHGYPKIFTRSPGIKGLTQYLGGLGVPSPLFFALVMATVEFFGGIAVLVGIATRWAALFIAVDMIVAIAKSSYKKGFSRGTEAGYEWEVAYLAIALVLLIIGPGPISVDWLLGAD